MGSRLHPLEKDIQASILDFLAVERIFAGRINTGGARRVRGVFISATHSFGAGTPDILAFPKLPEPLKDASDVTEISRHGARQVHHPGISPHAAAIDVARELRRGDRTLLAVLWIECKARGKAQRPEQINFQQAVAAEGHHYLLARSIDDVAAWLKENQ